MSDEPSSLHDLETRLVAFIRAFGLHQIDRTPCGQPLSTSDAHALTDLAEHGPLTGHDLAERLRLDKSTVSRMVKGLEAREWIERRSHPTDRRATHLHLTDAGTRVAAQVRAARRRKFERLLTALPEHERPAVLTALSTLVEALHDTELQPMP